MAITQTYKRGEGSHRTCSEERAMALAANGYFRRLSRRLTGDLDELDAEEILKRRYARGEISQTEFMQARDALR